MASTRSVLEDYYTLKTKFKRDYLTRYYKSLIMQVVQTNGKTTVNKSVEQLTQEIEEQEVLLQKAYLSIYKFGRNLVNIKASQEAITSKQEAERLLLNKSSRGLEIIASIEAKVKKNLGIK